MFSLAMLHVYQTVGEAHLMFVVIKKVHLVDITNSLCTVVVCAILGLNAV